MHVLLATGIYPPEIGGPATYARALAGELAAAGARVTVLAYGDARDEEPWPVHRVSRGGGPLLRWWRYACTLKRLGADVDIVYAFSSISVGVPLLLSRLRGPRRILRLGGDFLWERYTDRGGALGLKEWYDAGPWLKGVMNALLRSFDHIVFSTEFQEKIYERCYRFLPLHAVIENTVPAGEPVLHPRHEPFRLLFLGRFVAFKNLHALLQAVADTPGVALTLIGDGPLAADLRAAVGRLGIGDRVTFLATCHGEEKRRVFLDNDLLILPSLTELSPNVALEARAAGLPVLLTSETGLSTQLSQGIAVRVLRDAQQMTRAIQEMAQEYARFAEAAAMPLPARTWATVAEEHLKLFRSLL